MKALLVDDSKAARFAMSKLLKDQGLEVEVASSGEEALDKLATEPISIVFMDQSMPGMGGIAATRAITSNEKTAHIPVVLCTGNEGEKLLHTAKEAGAIGVLTKPPREEQLKEVLSNIKLEAAPAAFEEMATEEHETVDRETIMVEVDELVASLRQRVEELERQLQVKLDELGQRITATERKLQPLQGAVDNLDNRILEQVKEQLTADASNQRIQLEALRQQISAGLEEMEEREGRLRDALIKKTKEKVTSMMNRKLVEVRESLVKSKEETRARTLAMENRMKEMEQSLMAKSIGISIITAALAFASAYFFLT